MVVSSYDQMPLRVVPYVDVAEPTRANTRAGLPVPPTIGNGATMIAAPTGGSCARFLNDAMPYYLSFPSRK